MSPETSNHSTFPSGPGSNQMKSLRQGAKPKPMMRQQQGDEDDRFFALALDMLCVANSDGQFKRLNPAFAHTLGWTIEEMLARPALDFVHPADRQATLRERARLATGEPVIHFENRYLHKDGSFRLLAWKAVSQADGTVYAIARDVTKQRQIEVRLQKLNEDLERRVEDRTVEVREALTTLDAMEDAAFSFDPETWRFTYANRGAVRQLGYSREELLMMKVVDIKPEFDEARLRETVAPLLRGERPSCRFVTLHRHKDGHVFPVEINLQYVTPEGGRPRFISNVRDITVRQRNERLAHRSQRLEAIGTLAGGVAHDVNNALAPIMMAVEILRAQHPDSPGIVDLIESNARRGSDMMRQLLTFAKGADGELVSVQLNHLVKEMHTIMAGTFPKNIRLAFKCGKNLPAVLGDVTQLRQLVLNFCVNARDAMPRGGTLTLEAHHRHLDETGASFIPDARPGDYVVLSARDTGTGIAPEIIDRIFEPFFTTKSPEKGTGLGLSTVMGIVKGHGGFLQVFSHPGQGSEFCAYLPVDTAVGGPSPATSTGVEFHARGELILFVDDEAAMRKVADQVLQKLNFRSVTATDGVDGLLKATEYRIELAAVITDFHMPHLDGIGFVRALRRILPVIPILVISGRLDDAEKEEFSSLDVRTYLHKPFGEKQLATALQGILSPLKASL